MKIRVKGHIVPDPSPTFREMDIHPDVKSIILHNVESSNWREPTPIQMQAIPIMLQKRDILASAPTGSVYHLEELI